MLIFKREKSKKGTVTVFLQGGLGNQLFQLAAGIDVSGGSLDRLILDFTLLNHSKTIRQPELATLLNKEGFHSIKFGGPLPTLLLKLVRSVAIRLRFVRVFLMRFGFFVEVEGTGNLILERAQKCKKKIYLLGYFQNLESPQKIRPFLLSALKIENLHRLEFELVDFLGVHIRRGDYADFKDSYGIISEKSVLQICNAVLPSNFIKKALVASEDFEVASRISRGMRMNFESIELISTSASGIEVLKVLVNAKVLIMANSSLSWWGAFLNSSNADVYYPQPWFKSLADPQLYLEDWIPYSVDWEE